MNKIAMSLCTIAVALAGCNAPLPDRNLKEYVTDKDVFGEWTLTTDSMGYLVRDGFKKPENQTNQITFLADGTCLFHAVLDDFKSGTHYEATGTWKLEKDTTGDSNVKKKNAIRMELVLPTTTYLKYLNFDRRKGRLVLWSFYGDPDSWEFMEYEKAPNQVPEDTARKLADPQH